MPQTGVQGARRPTGVFSERIEVMARTREFTRVLDPALVKTLTDKRVLLFQKRLLPDCRSGDVFPAIRPNAIEFYYKGCLLFRFDGKFSIHFKYAGVLAKKPNRNYVAETELSGRLIPSFYDGYDRIKENIRHFVKPESEGVSNLYKTASIFTNEKPIALLDIEIALANEIDERGRIDCVMLNRGNGKIRFFEVKRLDDARLRRNGEKPEVIAKMKQYADQIAGQKKRIEGAYTDYANRLREILGLPAIEGTLLQKSGVDDTPLALLVFDYHRESRVEELIKTLRNEGAAFPIFPIGNLSSLKTGRQFNNLWKKTTKA